MMPPAQSDSQDACVGSLRRIVSRPFLAVVLFALPLASAYCGRSEGALGTRVFVIERATGTVAVVDYREMRLIKRIAVDADLKHASMVFEPGLRYGYIATRSGHLVRVDVERAEPAGRVATSKNSIGLAISQDGRTIAVSEYSPGGVTLVDTRSFQVTQRIEARVNFGGRDIVSRVTGMVDAPDNRFLCALMDADRIWELSPTVAADGAPQKYRLNRTFRTAVPGPFDALITPEGRYYLTGHLRSDRVSLLDLWSATPAVRSVDTGRSSNRIPVKMPHMESWSSAGDTLFVPLPGEKKLTMLSGRDFRLLGAVALVGDPVYAVVHPDHREIWVSFSGPEDGKLQIVDTRTKRTRTVLHAGKKIYHLVFTPRGDRALVSSNETNELLIIDTGSLQILKRIPLRSPSGIFGVWRAFESGL